MKVHLQIPIQSIPNPFASEIQYHITCLNKYAKLFQKGFSDE